MTESGPLRLLLLEDDPRDEELLRHELEKGGSAFELLCVDGIDAFRRELAGWKPDAILADYRLEGFTALDVLDEARRSDPDLPFILVTGSLGEEGAVEALRRGATDYILKDRPARLVEAVRSSVRAAADRRAARQAFELNRQIVLSSSVGITVYDRSLRYLVWNPVMEQLSGLPASEMVGKHPLEVLPVLRENGIYALMERALRGEVVQADDVLTSRPGAEPVWTSPRFSPLRDARGEIVGVIGMVRDVTARRRAEEQVVRALDRERTARAEIQEVLERVSDGFVSLDLEWRYTYMNRHAGAIFGRNAPDMIGKHIWTEFPEGKGQKFHLAYERAMREQKPFTIEEYYPPYDKWFENRIYPSPTGLSIFFSDVTERRKAEEARARLAMILEGTSDFVGFSDAAGNVLYVNAAGRRMVGLREGEPIPTRIADYHAVRLTRAYAEEYLPAAVRDGIWRGESRFLARDGREIPVSQVIVAHRNGRGEVERFSTIARDITDLKAGEEELRRLNATLEDKVRERTAALAESEERYRDLFENASDLIQSVGPDGRFHFVNRAWRETLGYAEEEVRRLSCWDVIHPDSRAHCEEIFRIVFAGKPVAAFEVSLLAKDGRKVLLEGRTSCRFAGGRPVASRGIFRDVTERRRALEALEASERKFRSLVSTVPGVVYRCDTKPPWRMHFISEAVLELTGYSPSEFMVGGRTWASIMVPEDVPRISAQTEEATRAGKPVLLEYRIRRADGTIRWVVESGQPVVPESGGEAYAEGVILDITPQKIAEAALEKSEEERVRLEELTRVRSRFEGIVGKSAPMQEVYRRLRLAGQSDVTVLLTGESGTGKELAAAAIHSLSARKGRPFVAVNCSAIPETLLESELFGHVKGAFTGAVRDKVGLFQSADGGTLFLDEVGDMPATVQVKVLRALQEREVRRVGDEKAVRVDVRIVAATNRDLAALIAKGTVREDFYYRVRVFEIALPPLRERKDDIPLLASQFVEELSKAHRKKVKGLTADALRRLMDYPWPGNVRELRNVLEHALVTVSSDRISDGDLPPVVRSTPAQPSPQESPERRRILEALKRSGGNRETAAKLLGISRVTLWKRIRKLGIEVEEL